MAPSDWSQECIPPDRISSGSNTIEVRGFSDDRCYSTTYLGHIATLWTFWECFVDLPLVVVAAVTIDWQGRAAVSRTQKRHVEPMNSINTDFTPFKLYLECHRFCHCNFLIRPTHTQMKSSAWWKRIHLVNIASFITYFIHPQITRMHFIYYPTRGVIELLHLVFSCRLNVSIIFFPLRSYIGQY